MYDLTSFTLKDMTDCGAALRKLDSGATSMEEVANQIVRYLYDHLVDGQSGEKSCALVRFFKTHPYNELHPELRECVHQILGMHPELPEMKCLTLLATAGVKPEWNVRQMSIGHKVHPLPSPDMVAQYPMVSQLIEQFGLELDAMLQPDPALLVDLERKTFNVFHVPKAAGSPYVPDQEDFVIPFGIQSVLGFGGMLPSGELFAVILFSKVHIPRETAELFKTLALSVKTAVLPFEGTTVFAGSHEPDRATHDAGMRDDIMTREVVTLRSQAAVMDQLLGVHEQVVREQASRLEQAAVAAERSRLARDLHDSVTQSLYSLTLLAEGWRRMATAGKLERVDELLAELGEISQQALREMRLLVYELRPPALEREGLLGALHQRLGAVEKRAGVDARLIAEEVVELPAPVEEGLYRVALEALNNALKHATATSVIVHIRTDNERVELEVVDNGRGFDPGTVDDRSGMGLISMRERMEKLGGSLTIRSTLGQGTSVKAVISNQ
ncbi:MAG: sensor histidine kinase [Anaerolineae bacterium]